MDTVPRWIDRTRSASAALLGLVCAGCVHFYQPMSDLHAPAVIDPRDQNFPRLALDVRCVPGDALDAIEASALCRQMRALFEQQGAQVTTGTTPRGAQSEADEEVADEPARPLQLTVELRAREVHRATDPLSVLLCLGTLTVVPAVSEFTFAQDVVIRDATGFLLADRSLEGRLVTRAGVGPWLGNHLLDLGRRREQRVTGDAAAEDLSSDLYQQLSQLVFNAQLQALVRQPAGSP